MQPRRVDPSPRLDRALAGAYPALQQEHISHCPFGCPPLGRIGKAVRVRRGSATVSGIWSRSPLSEIRWEEPGRNRSTREPGDLPEREVTTLRSREGPSVVGS